MTTERDLAVLRWVGEQYAVPLDVLGDVLAALAPSDAGTRAARFGRAGEGSPGPSRTGSSSRTAVLASRLRLARKHAARLEDLGLLERFRLASGVWVAPTRAGLRRVGLRWDAWDLSEWQLAHVEAVARLRLRLQAEYPAATWESDRAIRSRWAGSGARVRLADGALHWPDGTATGVEVELHVKRLDRYQGAVADRDPTWTRGVWWYCPANQVRLLLERLTAAGADRHHVVAELPEGVAP
jgi:hypothetical protein